MVELTLKNGGIMKKLLVILVIFLLPALADARLFYIAQSGTWTTYVVAMSVRPDAVDLEYTVVGDNVYPCTPEMFIAYSNRISIMPDT